MSERSIAEIIGWEWKTESWHEINYGGSAQQPYVQKTRDYWADPDGEEREPNVDDMLGWLTTQDRFCALSAVKGMQVMVEVVAGNTTRFHSVVRGDTLTSALGAAVRKVDAESLLD